LSTFVVASEGGGCNVSIFSNADGHVFLGQMLVFYQRTAVANVR